MLNGLPEMEWRRYPAAECVPARFGPLPHTSPRHYFDKLTLTCFFSEINPRISLIGNCGNLSSLAIRTEIALVERPGSKLARADTIENTV